MAQYKDVAVGSTVYFWFAANTTAGTAGDGATPLYDVRLAGAASDAAPTASGTPTLLSHANYTDGLHEIAIDTTAYSAGSEYAVFCTLTISSVNPAGFVGSFVVRAAASTLYEQVAEVLTRVPDATPGAAGGLLIAGTNAPVTITGSGNALTLTSTGGNGDGLELNAHGTGHGMDINPSTGHGIDITGEGTGIEINGQDSTGVALTSYGTQGALIIRAYGSAKPIIVDGDIECMKTAGSPTITIPGVTDSLTTALARIGAWTGTGLNTILGAFRALCGKTAALTPSDITAAATTFDNTTDSVEAIRDRGDAAWTSGTDSAKPSLSVTTTQN